MPEIKLFLTRLGRFSICLSETAAWLSGGYENRRPPELIINKVRFCNAIQSTAISNDLNNKLKFHPRRIECGYKMVGHGQL